jgi:hypothetical protein
MIKNIKIRQFKTLEALTSTECGKLLTANSYYVKTTSDANNKVHLVINLIKNY